LFEIIIGVIRNKLLLVLMCCHQLLQDKMMK